MEYFWLAERILAQICRQITEQQHEEVIAEAVCAAWCSTEPLTHRLMRQCVRWAVWKHQAHPYRSFPVLLPLHTLQEAIVPPPELPHQADVIQLADYRRNANYCSKVGIAKQA